MIIDSDRELNEKKSYILYLFQISLMLRNIYMFVQ